MTTPVGGVAASPARSTLVEQSPPDTGGGRAAGPARHRPPHAGRGGFEQKLAERPTIEVPTTTIASDFDGPNADGKAYADRFTGPYQHRILDGIGHNVPQEAPKVFAEAVLELARRHVAQPRS